VLTSPTLNPVRLIIADLFSRKKWRKAMSK
jgi:hypothetical protein